MYDMKVKDVMTNLVVAMQPTDPPERDHEHAELSKLPRAEGIVRVERCPS